MSYELVYFKEFLDDPSTPNIAEFYKMINRWGEYVIAHKGDFNYLKDKEWAEIRERLNVETKKRNLLKRRLEDEWEAFYKELEKLDKIPNPSKMLKILKRELAFMKTHKDFFGFGDKDIAECARDVKELETNLFVAQMAQENSVRSEREFEESLAKIDESMLKAEKKTGKIPLVQFWKTPKKSSRN